MDITVKQHGPDIHNGQLGIEEKQFPCALGRSGILRDKKEGDGGTPSGVWKVQACWFRSDKWLTPPQKLPTHKIKEASGWSDDPDDPEYNRPVTLPHTFSHEKLWRKDDQYDVIITLDHNVMPVVPGAGSAIFFHLAKPDYGPTEGCIAISHDHMREVLPLLTPGTKIIIQA
ncbi:MAG: hypothetical protein CBE09_01515 [Rhizobiales bacterium TMED249]|uniref:L,D-TPase catalytic domain-containing protein n=1 Tax=PS1 clade bacterium TaxID=2175152 RepID=A0A368E2Q9_9PROT|nr:MAG: hypothetical protein CBE09_01515 [Rhizobiales bacterium TMED249]RCL78379.1 MAG: hypothetical protein DBW69_00100 [PS1 clade bacterium]HAK99085.1 hypothetical protein [Rhodobiaceae bacterium]|tara:strand:- start:929 stop:1444 length:516 start_codon:yes stop_codon:yes gene_type:complete